MIRRPFSKLMEKNFILPSTVLLKKHCFDQAGLFDDSLRYVEDKDLWLRISMHYPMACVPFPLVKRRIHAYSPKQVEAIKESIIYVVRKMEKDFPDRIVKEEINTRMILGPLYYSLGRTYFDADKFGKAREAFRLSLRNGLSLNAALFWCVTLTGARFVNLLRCCKRGLPKPMDVRKVYERNG